MATAMKALSGAEIRRRFLRYFEERGHAVAPSSPLIPAQDPTLLFTNAGMVQFKDIFTGERPRPYPRAATSQKCVRAGGKHNDLDSVGYTARHHTFFEMLGNFSFGDYFKEEAIGFAWEFLTEDLGLPADRLHATVFRDDDEAYDLWRRKIGLPESRIRRCGEEDNFWAMGDTGPCGPCSEIHYDRGDGKFQDEGDRMLEVWNLVFMQYERFPDGTQKPLPKPSIDTGMGLERIASVLQGTPTNYETDLLRTIIQFTEKLSERQYGESPEVDVAMRVIADHARAMTFLIADGVLPSNEGRGYVLRRIMRRAARHGAKLGFTDPFLYEVSTSVVSLMGDAYPDLRKSAAFIAKAIQGEEERFGETLVRGLRVFNEEAGMTPAGGVIPGAAVFKLYDTYGFPWDLTADIARERGMTIDLPGFEREMEAQRERARAAGKFDAGEATSDAVRALPPAEFVGYDGLAGRSEILLLEKDGAPAASASAGASVRVAVGVTPFYGESGGQIGDAGVLRGPKGVVEIADAKKSPGGQVLHLGVVREGTISRGDPVTLEVDAERRRRTMLNHSATHLLHAALRKVLGEHVKQAGSYVGPDRLRFDFNHFQAVTREELDAIEDLANAEVQRNAPVAKEEMAYEAALARGALAFFGEKYGSTVRVVRMGDFSTELCGGTHVARTGDIGLVKIVSESSVAAGVRRIEAVTGPGALARVREQEEALRRIAAEVGAPLDQVSARIQKMREERKALEQQLRDLKKAKAGGGGAGDPLAAVREAGGVKVLALRADGDAGELRELADRLRDKLGSGVVALGAEKDGKALLLVAVTKDLAGKLHAGKLVGAMAEVVGGRGGGKPDFAQAGGSDPSKIDAALEKLYALVGN